MDPFNDKKRKVESAIEEKTKAARTVHAIEQERPRMLTNFEHYGKVEEALSKIKSAACWSVDDLFTASPLPLNPSSPEERNGERMVGFEKEYVKKTAEDKRTQEEEYRCGNNLFAANFMSGETYPINTTRVMECSSHFFAKPQRFRFEVVLVPPASGDPTLGAKRVSPAEPIHALLFAIARDIDKNVDKSILTAWERVLRSIPFVYKAHTTNVRETALQLREDIIKESKTCQHTVLQRLVEVAEFRRTFLKKKPTATDAELATAYKGKVKLDDEAEDITDHYIKQVSAIVKAVWTNERVQQVLLAFEKLPPSRNPLNSVVKIFILVQKASTEDELNWVFELLLEMIESQVYQVCDVNCRDLQKSLASKLLYKKQLHRHLLNAAMDNLDLPSTDKVCIRNALGDPRKFRAHSKLENSSLTWRAQLIPASVMYVDEIIEPLIFSKTYDKEVELAAKNRRNMESFFEVGVFDALIENVKSLITEMKEKEEAQEQQEEEAGEWAAAAKMVTLSAGSASEPASGEPALGPNAVLEKQRVFYKDDPDSFSKLERYIHRAEKVIKTHLQIVPEPTSEQQVMTVLMNSAPMKKTSGESVPRAGKFTALIYDPKVAGETMTRPKIRSPPLRENGCHFGKFVRQWRAARKAHSNADDDELELHENDMYIFFDGGREGNENKFMEGFQDTKEVNGKQKTITVPLRKKKVCLIYDEESQCARVERVKGVSLNQVETMCIITKNVPSWPDRPRTEPYTGSNRGNVIYPITLPTLTDDGRLKAEFAVKKCSGKHVSLQARAQKKQRWSRATTMISNLFFIMKWVMTWLKRSSNLITSVRSFPSLWVLETSHTLV